MPFVNLNIAYHYQSNAGTKTGSATGQTDSSGSYTLTSGFAGATYTIDASIYNQIFNSGNNTVSNLPTQATAQVFIICPIETLSISILGSNQEPIPNARIELVELSNGLFYSASTDSNGVATTQATFGMYRARVYKDTTLINETNVNLFSSSSSKSTAHCMVFNFQWMLLISLGAPISNADVTLNGPVHTSSVTQSNGKATFNNIIGGNMQIIAQVSGTQDASQAITVTVNQPSTVQIKIDKYVTLGSILIQTSALFTILVILIIIILFAIVEVYQTKKS